MDKGQSGQSIEREIRRNEEFALFEFKRLNDRLANERRSSSAGNESVVEAAFTVGRYIKGVNELTAMLRATRELQKAMKG